MSSTGHLDREAQDGDRAREDEEQPRASRIRNQGGCYEESLNAGSLASKDKGKEKRNTMGKRANGEGTVYRRNDGRWVASISLDNGKRKSIYCKTQREAIREVQRANQAKEQGMLSVREDETLGTFLTSWLQDTAKPNLRPRTYIRYRELMELHVVPTLGSVKLHKVTPQQLQKLYTKAGRGLRASNGEAYSSRSSPRAPRCPALNLVVATSAMLWMHPAYRSRK